MRVAAERPGEILVTGTTRGRTDELVLLRGTSRFLRAARSSSESFTREPSQEQQEREGFPDKEFEHDKSLGFPSACGVFEGMVLLPCRFVGCSRLDSPPAGHLVEPHPTSSHRTHGTITSGTQFIPIRPNPRQARTCRENSHCNFTIRIDVWVLLTCAVSASISTHTKPGWLGVGGTNSYRAWTLSTENSEVVP
jgi:hypothetical protein